MKTIEKVVEHFEEGRLVRREAVVEIFDLSVEEGAKKKLDALPEDWIKDLEDFVDEMPTTEEGWKELNLHFAGIGMHETSQPNFPTVEENRKWSRERTEFLRTYFEANGS